jgi:hypothetical protein
MLRSEFHKKVHEEKEGSTISDVFGLDVILNLHNRN